MRPTRPIGVRAPLPLPKMIISSFLAMSVLGQTQITSVAFRQGDSITRTHICALLMRNHLGLLPLVGSGFGNENVVAVSDPLTVCRMLEKYAPTRQFSIYISGCREFSDPKLDGWKTERSFVDVQRQVPGFGLLKALASDMKVADQVGSVSYRVRRYLGIDQKWHRGLEVALFKPGIVTVFQVMHEGAPLFKVQYPSDMVVMAQTSR